MIHTIFIKLKLFFSLFQPFQLVHRVNLLLGFPFSGYVWSYHNVGGKLKPYGIVIIFSKFTPHLHYFILIHFRHIVTYFVYLLQTIPFLIISDQKFVWFKFSEIVIYFFEGAVFIHFSIKINYDRVATTKLRFNIGLNAHDILPIFVCRSFVSE